METIRRFLLLLGGLLAFAGLQAQNLRPEANEKGKFGYVDNQGKKVISYKYTEAYPFEEGLAKVKKGDKYGFINPKGDAVGKIKYTLILPFTGTFCRVAVGGSYKDGILKGAKWGFLNKRGEEILPPKYDEIGEFEDGVAYVINGKKYGLVDEHAQFLLEPKYVAVGLFDKFGHCWFASSGKLNKKTGKLSGAKYGLINREGKVVVPAKYLTLGYFFKYKRKDTQEIVDYNATISSGYGLYALQRPLSRLFNPENYYNVTLATAKTKEAADTLKLFFDNIEISTEGDFLFYGKGLNRYGIMNDRGDIVVPEKKFHEVHCPSNGIALVGKLHKKKMEYGYYNVESGYLKEFEENEILQSYIDGVGKIQNKNDRTAYFVDKSGNRVTDVFRMAMNFDKGMCVVQDNASGRFGVIDNKGKSVLPFEYDDVKANFSEDMLGVCKAGKWGIADRTGSIVIPLTYQNVSDFRHGWAAAQIENGRWGMIDKENRQIVPFEWGDLKLVDEPAPRYIWGKDGALWYCYDLKKKAMAFSQGFEDASNFKENHAYVAMGGKYGMIDVNGNLIVPCKMDNFSRLKNALAYMEKLGKTSLNDTDAFRLNIYEDVSVNAFKITDRIPDDKWDY